MPRAVADRLSKTLSAPAKPTPPEGWWENAFHLTLSPSEASGHRCGAKQMLTLIAYDIANPKRLHKVATICEDFGVRIQYSVFECRLHADLFDSFWSKLLSAIDPKTDRLTAYKVCTACAKDIRDAGIQTHSEVAVAYVF